MLKYNSQRINYRFSMNLVNWWYIRLEFKHRERKVNFLTIVPRDCRHFLSALILLCTIIDSRCSWRTKRKSTKNKKKISTWTLSVSRFHISSIKQINQTSCLKFFNILFFTNFKNKKNTNINFFYIKKTISHKYYLFWWSKLILMMYIFFYRWNLIIFFLFQLEIKN
jgi:hypothetical protein